MATRLRAARGDGIAGGRVTRLQVAASYACRTRDYVVGAKLSEHAFGNAIDISAFMVQGRWIEVGGAHDSPQQTFLDDIRAKACGPLHDGART